MTAKIGLKDVRIHAPHGYFEEEHLMGNEFSIDVEVDAQIGGAASEDDLGQTVNYATIHYLLKVEMKRPTQLLEALAYRMAARIADQFDNVSNVKIRLHKLNPPLGGKVASSWVEVSVAASGGSGGGRGGYDDYGSSYAGGRTFEDYVPHFDVDGPFAGPGGGGGGMTGAPSRPRPVTPQISPPTAAPPPPLVFDEAAFELAGDGDEEFYDGAGEEEMMDDGDFDMGDFELPEGFDPGDLEGFDFDGFDFEKE
ncbi:dihydroneopterin aldolase [Neolewinella antarctica]|uniref:7,8-dihydroneopterin aldolase n=1 Tax=Neolewinella antarctica TaxID=442734 RepID=A0ABX0XDF3_9BACT|nr:dihydroneopterin aldolase [Neolewinella antarctica]NJC27338.1 dihydroneopterin aldolase [Neolewinella antarctica]